jgi:hypothetical protein
MTKRFKMNLQTGDVTELGGTDSLPHPGNFPLGSIESRAAARAIIASGRFRSGDRGTFRCGCTFIVVGKQDAEGREMKGMVQIILPKDFSPENTTKQHMHDFEVLG